MSSRTVSELARLAGITVRTLHHYDQIELLSPSSRTDAGYRLYTQSDLERLQEVLFFRELGFELGEIARLLDSPQHDRGATLHAQRGLLERRTAHLQAMLAAIDRAIEAQEGGIRMNADDMFEVFGDFDPKAHEAEAEARWSGELMDESKRRTSQYSKEQWKQIMAEGEEIAQAFAAAMTSGAAAESDEATAVAERHRVHIDQWFYPCSYEVHGGLGELYVTDSRFASYWDGFADGLAPYVRAAIAENVAGAE